jgi:hypothetical protein
MDVNPDLIAAVAVEAWVMARCAAVVASNPGVPREQAVEQSIAELRRRYPHLGGTVRQLNAAAIFG